MRSGRSVVDFVVGAAEGEGDAGAEGQPGGGFGMLLQQVEVLRRVELHALRRSGVLAVLHGAVDPLCAVLEEGATVDEARTLLGELLDPAGSLAHGDGGRRGLRRGERVLIGRAQRIGRLHRLARLVLAFRATNGGRAGLSLQILVRGGRDIASVAIAIELAEQTALGWDILLRLVLEDEERGVGSDDAKLARDLRDLVPDLGVLAAQSDLVEENATRR